MYAFLLPTGYLIKFIGEHKNRNYKQAHKFQSISLPFSKIVDLTCVLTFKIYIHKFLCNYPMCVCNLMKLLVGIFDEHYPGKRIGRGFYPVPSTFT